MALPQLTTPEFLTELPSTKEQIAFRPFLVKEEKILLMAQQGKDKQEVFKAVIQILQNCIKTPVEIEKLATFDLEWLFLQLRAKSVGEILNLRLVHQKKECKGSTDVEIDLKDVKVSYPEDTKDHVMLDDNIGVKLKYPSLDMLNKSKLTDPSIEDIFLLLDKCIINVFDKNQVYNDFTSPELQTFLENLDQKQFNKIVDFFNRSPKIRHVVEYKCAKCGEIVKYPLEGLLDFFT